MTEGTQFYYNLSSGAVEEGRQSPATELMGPYSTREEAQQALATAAARNEKWDEEDALWEGDDESPTGADESR